MNNVQLEKIANLLSVKYSTLLTFNSRESDFTCSFPETLQLDPNYNYEVGLLWFSTYNTIFNITDQNNRFTVAHFTTGVIKQFSITPGAYELETLFTSIEEMIIRECGIEDPTTKKKISPIKFKINLPTAKIHLFVHKDYSIAFVNKLGKFLGFTKLEYTTNSASEGNVNITSITSINVLCDLITGSYQDGKKDNCLFGSVAIFAIA